MSTRIEVEKTEPGMILAEPILTPHGQVMLPAGSELTVNNIKILKNWGVRSVTIEDGEGSPADTILTEEMAAQAAARVRERMRWEPTHPAEKEIYEAAVKHAGSLILKGKKE